MSYQEPWHVEAVCREDRVNHLRRWAGSRCDLLRGQSKFAGGKHPIFCLLGTDLLEAWNHPTFVVVDRPVKESINFVLHSTDWKWPEEAVRYALPRMIERRDKFLRDHAPRHVRISYRRFASEPARVLEDVCSSLQYVPSIDQEQATLAFVRQWFVKSDAADPSKSAGRNSTTARRPALPNSRPAVSSPFLACVGLHRSGSSCVAGVLHRLGVHMGNRFVGCEADGGFEAEGIASICERYMPFPGIEKRLDDQSAKRMLSAWIHEKVAEASAKGTIAGAKYPHLSAMGEMLLDICQNAVFVVNCERPLEESIASLIRRDGNRLDRGQLETVQRYLWQRKSSFLSAPGIQVHDVNYHALLQNPEAEVRKLARFLPLEIDEARICDAAGYVKPEKRHIALFG